MEKSHKPFGYFGAMLVLLLTVIANGEPYRLVSSVPSNPTCQTHGVGLKVSSNGRWVFYESSCADYSPGAPPSSEQNIYGYDLETGQTKFVSILPNRRRGSSAALLDVSADGRYVVFSGGVRWILGQPELPGIYIRDIQLGTTIQISDRADSFTRASISANGEAVAFQLNRDTIYTEDTYVWTRASGQTTLVNVPVRPASSKLSRAFGPMVSTNGRYVFFNSDYDNLVAADTNNDFDIFVRDLGTQTTALVSVNRGGVDSGDGQSFMRTSARNYGSNNSNSVISADGRYVVFGSSARNLVPGIETGGLFIRDLVAGTTALLNANLSYTTCYNAYDPLISADGRFASFRGQWGFAEFGGPLVPLANPVYHRDLQLGQTSLLNWQYPNDVSFNVNTSRNVGISADGRYELFTVTSSSGSIGRENLYWVDNATHQTRLINQGSGSTTGALYADMSADGLVIAFATKDRLVDADDDNQKSDIYVFQGATAILTTGIKGRSH